MSGFEHVRWTLEDGIAVVTLDRQPVNAISQLMYREIAAAFGPDSPFVSSAKVVVVEGAGRHFCAGNDLEEFGSLTPENSDDRMAEVRAAFFAIQDCPIPVIGAVRGAALGSGLAIAASCDFLVAADNARFGTPEVGVGVMGGARHLARMVPQGWVRWMYFTAEPLGAAQMQSLGAVVEVVPVDQLSEAALRHARMVSRYSGPVIRMAKRSLDHVEEMDLQPGYVYEQSRTTELSGHADSAEARAALLERRAPRYPSELDGTLET